MPFSVNSLLQYHATYLQKITFTNWLNDRLKAGRQGTAKVRDLSEDLRDGILLIKLLENLTKKKIKGFTKNPKMPAHKLNNLELAIDFMRKEDLKLIGIGKRTSKQLSTLSKKVLESKQLTKRND